MFRRRPIEHVRLLQNGCVTNDKKKKKPHVFSTVGGPIASKNSILRDGHLFVKFDLLSRLMQWGLAIFKVGLVQLSQKSISKEIMESKCHQYAIFIGIFSLGLGK